jgi:choline-sulfatase
MVFRWALLSVLLFAHSSPAAAVKPANIVLITLDTTRADRMGFLNSKSGLTPNLDSLAHLSAVFSRAYAHVPLTTPSHATILTGTFPQFNRVSDLGSPLDEALPYLPDILRQHGYRTAAFVGSQVLDPKGGGAPGFNRGFDTYNAPFHTRGLGEDRYASVERRGMMVVDSALAWLRKRSEGPFFVWLHFYDPHDPYDPPPPFNSRDISPYDGEIAYMDSAIGTLLAGLRSQGQFDQTIIVVVADHGEAFGEHGERSHGVFLYDETLHVPLVLKMPASASRAHIDARVGLVDITPTLLQAVGIAPPASMQGESLLGLMRASSGAGTAARSNSPGNDRPEYAETDYPYRAFGWSSLRSWRAGKYLYVDAPRPELYDQLLDPTAAHNLVKETPGVAATMAAQLEEFRRKTARTGTAEAILTPHQVEQLQALGYVSSGSNTPESEQKERGPDPKDKVEIANLLHQALLETEEEHYREAIPLFEQILKAEPNLPLANLQLGRAWNRLQEYAKATPYLQRAVALTPKSSEAHFELGGALGEIGDAAGSANQMEEAVGLDPSSDELHFRLGSAYEEIDRIDDAIKQYRAALSLNADNFPANLFLGRRLAMQDHPQEALPFLLKAAKLEPQSADAHKFLGSVYTVLGDEEQARRERAEAQRLNEIGHP